MIVTLRKIINTLCGCVQKACSALMAAVDAGHSEIVKIFLKAGARVDLFDSDKYTPLMKAAEKGQAEIVNVLLQAGASVNLSNNVCYSLSYRMMR